MSLWKAVLRWVFSILGLLVITAAAYVLLNLSKTLPARITLLHIDLKPPLQGFVVAGAAEFLQPAKGAMDERHIAVARSEKGIELYDISPRRRVGYRSLQGKYADTASMYLPPGTMNLWIGDKRWQAFAQQNRLQLHDGKVSITLTPYKVRYAGKGFEQISTIPFLERFTDWLRSWLRPVSRRYVLGGQVSMENLAHALRKGVLPDADLPRRAAVLIHDQHGWRLAPGRLPAAVEAADAGRQDVQARPLLLIDSQGNVLIPQIILGRTLFAVFALPEKAGVRLVPLKRRVWIDRQYLRPLPEGDTITRSHSTAQPRLSPIALREAYLMGALVAAVFLLLGMLPILRILRAPGIAATGLALALLPQMPFSLPALSATMWALGWGLMAQAIVALALRHHARISVSVSGMLALVAILPLVLAWFFHITSEEPLGSGASQPLALAFAGVFLAMAAPLLAFRVPPWGSLFWSLFLAVALFGMLAGANLTLLSAEERWLGLMEKHLVALAIIGFAVAVSAAVLAHGAPGWAKRALVPRPRPFLAKVVFVILFTFAVAIAVGDETGFMGVFQPSEMAKSVLVMLVVMTLAHDLSRRSLLTAPFGAWSLWPLAALFLAAAILVASASNYDMSPILVSLFAALCTLMVGGMLHMWVLGRRRNTRRLHGLPIPVQRGGWLLLLDTSVPLGKVLRRQLWMHSHYWPLLLLLLFVAGVAGVYATYRNDFAPGAPVVASSFLVTPWLRMQSWWDMALTGDAFIDFPEAGLQLRLGREALLHAHCAWGAWLQPLCPEGVSTSPSPLAVQAMLRVPAIQDDFVAVALVHALGADGAMLYGLAQAAMLGSAFTIGVIAMFTHRSAALGEWVVGCAAIGLTMLIMAQVFLAWGNVLGWTPVMGQPMTFASFGASHHLGVALPFAVMIWIASYMTVKHTGDYRYWRMRWLRSPWASC